MQKIFNPKWLFLVNTLPIAILFFLLFEQFNIIKTLLNENALWLWKTFGISLGALGILNFVYAVYLTVKKQRVSVLYGIIALVCHIAFIYSYGFNFGYILPRNIPGWMILDSLPLYVFTFLMPTLAYSLFVLVIHFTPETKEHKASRNFLITISIPVGAYLFIQIIFPLIRFDFFKDYFHIHILTVSFIVITLVFFFFLVRSIFIIAAKKAHVWKKYQLAWKTPIALVLPLLGLWVNNTHKGEFFSPKFGNFSNHWFYILALLNGILICLPNIENKIYRMPLFALRSMTFAYTFYFFLVFLPISPLSIIAIIFVGLGFLMLTPLLLFIIHIAEISKDFEYLKTWFSKKSLIAISVLCFMVIPMCITVTYMKDKSVLNEALEYLYAPDYSKQYSIDKKSLRKTLKVIGRHQEKSGDFNPFSSSIPYLTSYFNWLVLDNQSLSHTKLNYIGRVFFASSQLNTEPNFRSQAEITNISVNSNYDKSQNAWKSWVDLEITNGNTNLAEYATTIDLPEGCWISDYYLYVEGKKEFGILAEKKAAMWVYSNIRNENKDPGILHYLTGNKVAFKVFPFSPSETRKTGIEFLCKERTSFFIDSRLIILGNWEETVRENVETENFAYISANQKLTLKKAERKLYPHFLIDASAGKEKFSDDFTKQVEALSKGWYSDELRESKQISFVNTYINPEVMYEGGFYLERAIETVLLNAYNKQSYPFIVVVTDSIQNAILEKDFSDIEFAFPELAEFASLGSDGTYRIHSLLKKPKEGILTPYIQMRDALEYKLSDSSVVYLPKGYEPSIVLKKEIFEIAETEIKEKNWQSALAMHAKRMSHFLHPEKAVKEWQTLVKYSFISKIMTPETSYLVVENEAQKAALMHKQKQVLSGNKLLDLNGDTQQMSEPSLWLLLALLGLALVLYNYVFKRSHHKR